MFFILLRQHQGQRRLMGVSCSPATRALGQALLCDKDSRLWKVCLFKEAEGQRKSREEVVGVCPSERSRSCLVLAAGAELQQANIWAEPLAVLAIFSRLLLVRRLGLLPKNSGMKQKLFFRIVWNGITGIISS